MVVCFEEAGVPYACVTLERAHAVALVDLSDPTCPAVRSVTPIGDGRGHEPEGLAHFRDADGAHWIYAAGEESGAVGVYRVVF